MRILSADERARRARFRFDMDRRRYLVGRGILRLLVGHCLNVPTAETEFECGASGKPRVRARVQTPLQFNVSHSGEVVLIALARGRALGIDVEPRTEAMQPDTRTLRGSLDMPMYRFFRTQTI
jgi:4'-phosphopantetheinyl transferase